MKALLMLALCLPAHAGPTGSAGHAAAPTGFPGAYLGSVALSLQGDAFYGSRLLDSFDLHLRSVAAMTSPVAVAVYLENAAFGANGAKALKASLGVEPIDTQKAAALLVAHALTRPEQFHEVLVGLESQKAGLGKQAARLLREVKGQGDRRLLAVLRERGTFEPHARWTTYDRSGRLNSMFDGAGPAVEETPVSPDWTEERSVRRSGLTLPAKL